MLPTLSDGFAITQLEAMAHAVPIIATPNCGAVVTHGKDGFVVPIRDSAALAGTIQKYLKEPGMLTAHSSAAVKKAAEFSLEYLSTRLSELERSLMAARLERPTTSDRRLQPAGNKKGGVECPHPAA
jgi:glycosyltransferase involved in cell wall biosynthesis